MDLNPSVIGFLVGLLVGMTGVGGGALLTPFLILFYGVAPVVAVGTDLAFAALTKSVGTWTHSHQGTVEWPVVGLLAAGSVPSAIVTTLLLAGLSADAVDALINGVLGVALVMSALALLFRNPIRTAALRIRAPAFDSRHRLRKSATVLGGAVLGALVSLSSIGAGALGAALLTLLYPRMTMVKVVGTDIAHAVPLASVAGLGHYHLGSLDAGLLLVLLLGSVPGIYLGSRISWHLPEYVTRVALASVLFSVGLGFVFQGA